MEITTTGTESTTTMHFDTRLTFEVDGDGKVIGGSKSFTEQELFDMLQPAKEEEIGANAFGEDEEDTLVKYP